MAENNDRHEQTLRAAWLYHERGLNQQSVADRMGVSRSTVSRLLSEAEKSGIVRVVLTEPLPETSRLSERLIERYRLAGAVVEPTLDDESPRVAAATALARRLERMVSAGPCTIGTGWGRTLGAGAQATRTMRTSGVTVVDAFGHTTTKSIANSVEVSNTLGRHFGAQVVHIPSPGFAASAEIAANFYDSEPVQSTLELARAADAVIVSIGVVGPSSLLAEAGYIDDEGMAQVIEAGAIGEVFGRYYDLDGKAVVPEATHPVSLTMDDLRRCRRVIGGVGGAEKADSVRGAIAAGIINELACDDTLARALLD